MSKPFSDVFTTLQLNETKQLLFMDAEVEKIVSTKSRDYLRIYLRCDRLIPKQDIQELEREIKRSRDGVTETGRYRITQRGGLMR